MTPRQEPKYIARDGGIYNRASGEGIPGDEPVFIFRARDTMAADALLHYYTELRRIGNDAQADAVLKRLQDFQRFAREHGDRMKTPDTAL